MLFILGVIFTYVKMTLLGIVAQIVSSVEEILGKGREMQVLPQYQSNMKYMKLNVVELDQMKLDLQTVLKGSHTKAPNISPAYKTSKISRPKITIPSKIQWILPFCDMKLGDYRLINKQFETEQNSQLFLKIENIISKFSKWNSANRVHKRKNPRFVHTRLTVIYEDIQYR